jgi:hypothetical protein
VGRHHRCADPGTDVMTSHHAGPDVITSVRAMQRT